MSDASLLVHLPNASLLSLLKTQTTVSQLALKQRSHIISYRKKNLIFVLTVTEKG